jgi:glyoxylase-like metal-dependent hydrolase (beta-lactamase superfamily II)
VAIDPAAPAGAFVDWLEAEGLGLEAILLTHGHSDHISGVGEVRARTGDPPIVVGASDAAMLPDPSANLSAMFGAPTRCPLADRIVEAGDKVASASLEFRVLALPGHTPGGVGYLLEPEATGGAPVAFSGDAVFAGSIGRTDFPGGDGARLLASIADEILSLPDETVLYPGHGPATTVGRERRSNPFL